MNIGDRLKLIRGTTKQDEFSVMLDVNKGTIGRWERGEQVPDTNDLNRIIKLFPKINPAWLLTGEGEMKRGEGTAQTAGGSGSVLDEGLLEHIIIEIIKNQRWTEDETQNLFVEILAQSTAASIIHAYKLSLDLPVEKQKHVIDTYNKLFARLDEKLNVIADKRGM